MQQEQAFELLIASPMCAAFSALQNLNCRKMKPKELHAKLKEAMSHIDFALHMCAVQAKGGRYFLFEHLVQAKSWGLSRVKHMAK